MIGLKNLIKKLEARLPPQPPPPTPEELAERAEGREHIASLPGGLELLEAMDAAMSDRNGNSFLIAFTTSVDGRPTAYQWCDGNGKSYRAG